MIKFEFSHLTFVSLTSWGKKTVLTILFFFFSPTSFEKPNQSCEWGGKKVDLFLVFLIISPCSDRIKKKAYEGGSLKEDIYFFHC